MRVLLSAYACEPGKGSEPGVGWLWAKSLAKSVDLSVVTRANHRAAIEACNETWIQHVTWIYYDLPSWTAFWKRGSSGTNLYYWLWQIGVFFKIRPIHRHDPFDLTHHITFGRYWVPSFLSRLHTPFVLGPVGGGEDIPSGLTRSLSLGSRLKEQIRKLCHYLARLDPVLRSSVTKRCSTTIAATRETQAKLASLKPRKIVVQPQCALDASQLLRLSTLPPIIPDRFRIISIGRLVAWKGYHLAIEAFAELLKQFPEAEYWLVNDGPERERLQSLATRLRVGSRIRFLGRLASLDNVYAALGGCDVLFHPALRESFGNVCLEAMAAGRPVVCFKAGGPGLQISDEVGFAIPPSDEPRAIQDFCQALASLARDPNLRQQMGEAAQKRVRLEFSQSAQLTSMLEIYDSLVRRR